MKVESGNKFMLFLYKSNNTLLPTFFHLINTSIWRLREKINYNLEQILLKFDE